MCPSRPNCQAGNFLLKEPDLLDFVRRLNSQWEFFCSFGCEKPFPLQLQEFWRPCLGSLLWLAKEPH